MDNTMNNSENELPGTAPADEKEALLRETMAKLGMEPLTPKQKNRAEVRRRYFLPRLLAVLAAAVLAAWLFSAPAFRQVTAETEADAVTVRFAVSKALLLDSVTASLDGAPVQAQALEPGTYQVQVPKNGMLILTAHTFAGRTAQTKVDITGVDLVPPEISRDEVRGGVMYIYYKDAGSGVDWQSVQVICTDTGAALPGVETDSEAGCVYFPFPESEVRITVADNNGNPLTALLRRAEGG